MVLWCMKIYRDTMNELIGMMLVSTRIAHSVHICIYFDVCVKKGMSSDLDHMVGILFYFSEPDIHFLYA
jgi:hypothetical protein